MHSKHLCSLIPASHQASQHGEAGLLESYGGLFAGCSPAGGSRLPPDGGLGDTPEDRGGADGLGAADQSPQHKRRATPASVQAAARCSQGGSPLSKAAPGRHEAGVDASAPGENCGALRGPRRMVSQLQQEQMLLAAQQLAEQQRQAQLAAWAADAGAEAGADAPGSGIEAAHGAGGRVGRRRGPGEGEARMVEEDKEDGWSPPGSGLHNTGRVLFT
jgi:hypothetical protein